MTANTNAQDIKISQFEGFEQLAAIIAGRPLSHFSRVRSFHYFGLGADFLLNDIVLVIEELELPRAQIGIRFHGVADVSFSGFSQIMGLYFQNIQGRGWERVRFEIGDYEDSHIHLFCHEISVFDPRKAA
jgi:hypothetical protein